jgi:maltose O-acetyltransferase
LRLTSPERVRIGSNCQFNYDVYIAGGGGVTIGDWVGFGPDAKIWSVNHRFDDPDTPWQQQDWDRKPVTIEDDVWIAANVFVMPGVTIGRGAIISAGSIVNKSIPPFAIVSGNPARVVGWRRSPTSAVADGARGLGVSCAEGVTPDASLSPPPVLRQDGTLHESRAGS